MNESSEDINKINEPNLQSTSTSTTITPMTPVPWKQVIIILLVRFSEPISMTLLFPFVYAMVRSFHMCPESEVGYYAGTIASSFAFCQFLTSIHWGRLSDKIGRRPVIIMGLLGTSFSLLCFGLAKSWIWAVVFRGLCGLLNGNIGVLKAMVAEITDKTNRAYTFAFLPMVFGLGASIGPVLGGYLANPMEKYSNWITNPFLAQLLTEYPYFLPCFISSMLCLFSAVIGIFFLEETLVREKPKQDDLEENLESTPSASSKTTANENQPLLDDNNNNNSDQSLPKWIWISIFTYGGVGLSSIMLDELTPFWLYAEPDQGGPQFRTDDIGIITGYCGLALLLIQFFIFVPIQRRFGSRQILRVVFFYLAFIVVLYPLSNLFFNLNRENLKFWNYLFVLSTLKTLGTTFMFAAANLMIMESCPRPILGKTSGIAQTFVSFMRTIGPYITGLCYSWSMKNQFSWLPFYYPFTWLVISFILLFTQFLARLIPVID